MSNIYSDSEVAGNFYFHESKMTPSANTINADYHTKHTRVAVTECSYSCECECVMSLSGLVFFQLELQQLEHTCDGFWTQGTDTSDTRV